MDPPVSRPIAAERVPLTVWRHALLRSKGVICFLCVALCWCLASVSEFRSPGLATTFVGVQSGREGSVSGTSGHVYKIQHSEKYQPRTSLVRGGLTGGLGQSYDRDPEARICDVWAVITTINPPTRTVQQLAGLPHVCVCVVGDRKTPGDFHFRNVTYLSPEAQEKLPYKTATLLPWNHFGRKALGYLYAIHHGAKVIYDTDDDNELVQEDLLPYLEVNSEDIVRYAALQAQSEAAQKGVKAVNVYALFGAEQTWPRGFPLDQIRHSAASATSRTMAVGAAEERRRASEQDSLAQSVAPSVAVIQSLANHDPDVDAIYRLSTLPLPFDFKGKVGDGLTALPYKDLLCPFNAQATLHFASEFWGLLLPITVHGRVSDIWRSYFTERLLWEMREPSIVAFAPPWVTQQRNPHSYLADFQAEAHLYERASALVAYLAEDWECTETHNGEYSLPVCLRQLYIDMFERGILGIEDVELVSAWIDDLRAVGYSFPEVAGSEVEEMADTKKEWVPVAVEAPAAPLLILADKAAKPLIELASVTGQYIEEALVTADLHPQLREALSLRNLPTLKQGRIMSQQLTSHEGNSDLDNFVYQIEGNNSLVLFDMEGPGCIQRAFLIQSDPTADMMLRLDGQVVMEGGVKTIFSSGLDGKLPSPFLIYHNDGSGMDLTYPLCFRSSALLTLTFKKPTLLQEYADCIRLDKQCPDQAYMDIAAERWTEVPTAWGAESGLSSNLLPPSPPAEWAASWEDYMGFNRTVQRIRSDHAGPELHEVELAEGTTVQGKGGHTSLLDLQGTAGAVRAIVVKVNKADWDKLWWEMRWDQDDSQQSQEETEPQVLVPFNRLHNSWTVGDTPFAGYRLGAWEEGGVVTGYVFHPMPFSRRASVRIINRDDAAVAVAATLLYTAEDKAGRSSSASYAPGSVGHYFVHWVQKPWGPCFNELLSLQNQTGHVVGHSWRLTGSTTVWVENDPVVYTDDARSPRLWFSGLEDEIGGAHGFRHLHSYGGPAYGWFYDTPGGEAQERIGAYVSAMADPRVFMKSLVYGIQGHVRDEHNHDLDYTFHYYASPSPSLRLTDEMDMGDQASLARHGYQADPYVKPTNLTASVNGQWHYYAARCPEDADELVTRQGTIMQSGMVSWEAEVDPMNRGIVLRRLIDLYYTPQRARVQIDGEEVGIWTTTDHGSDYAPSSRFADNTDFLVPARFTRGKARITITMTVEPRDATHSRRRDYAHIKGFAWTAFHYWVYSMVEPGK